MANLVTIQLENASRKTRGYLRPRPRARARASLPLWMLTLSHTTWIVATDLGVSWSIASSRAMVSFWRLRRCSCAMTWPVWMSNAANRFQAPLRAYSCSTTTGWPPGNAGFVAADRVRGANGRHLVQRDQALLPGGLSGVQVAQVDDERTERLITRDLLAQPVMHPLRTSTAITNDPHHRASRRRVSSHTPVGPVCSHGPCANRHDALVAVQGLPHGDVQTALPRRDLAKLLPLTIKYQRPPPPHARAAAPSPILWSLLRI